jgi:hypothetical protein
MNGLEERFFTEIISLRADHARIVDAYEAKLAVAERMAQALDIYRNAFDDEARAVLAEWEALK